MATDSITVSPTFNGDTVRLTAGMIVRLKPGANNNVVRAQGDSTLHLQGVNGVVISGSGAPKSSVLCACIGRQTVQMESGLTLAVGDTVYVSSTVPGKGTNVLPTAVYSIGYVCDTSAYAITKTVEVDVLINASGTSAGGGAFFQFIENQGGLLPQYSTWNISTGLTGADNPGSSRIDVTNNLSTGVLGGQSVIGGTGPGDNLTFVSSTDSTNGTFIFDDAAVSLHTFKGTHTAFFMLSNIVSMYGGNGSSPSNAGFHVGSAGGPPIHTPYYFDESVNAAMSLAGQNANPGAAASAGWTFSAVPSGNHFTGRMLGTGWSGGPPHYSPQTAVIETVGVGSTGTDLVVNVGSASTTGTWYWLTGDTLRGQLTFAGSLALQALAGTTATAGYFYVPSCAGPPTGIPEVVAGAGTPLAYDTTDNKLYAFNGSWRSVALT